MRGREWRRRGKGGSLASATAEADDSPMADALHLVPDAVHFYLRDCPAGWGRQVHTCNTEDVDSPVDAWS
jgi:hypothetical protein